MQFGTELDVVAPSTEIAEQRLADSRTIAVVAIFHKNCLEKRLAFAIFCAKPHGRPETGARNGIKRRKPKDLVREAERGGLEGSHSPLRVYDYEYSKLRLAESLFEVAGDCILQIVLDFAFPNGKAFIPQIYFKKRRQCLLRSANLDIAIRNEACASLKRFVEGDPLLKSRFRNGDWPKLQIAINLVDRQLVSDEKISNENLVPSPSRPLKRSANELRSRCGERIESLLPSGFRSEKKSSE